MFLLAQYRNCPFCGAQVPPGSSFCSNCGAQIPPAQAAPPPAPPSTPPPAQAPPPSPPPTMPAYQPYQAMPPPPKMEISIGSTVSESISLYVGHLFQFFIPYLILGAIAELILFGVEIATYDLWVGGEIFVSFLVGAIGGILSMLLWGIAGGMIIKMAFDLYLGRDTSVGDSIALARDKLGTIIVASIPYAIGVGIGLILFILPGAYLMTIWAVYVQCIILEDAGATESLSRSSNYTKNNRWEIFVVMAILSILTFLASSAIYLFVPTLGSALADRIGVFIVEALMAPLTTVAGTIIYVKLRQIKGGPAPSAA